MQTMSDELSSKVCHVRGEKITTSLNVVPVHIMAHGKEVKTNAFLDQGSTTTLCDERLVDALGLSGEPVTFSLSTLNRGTRKAEVLNSLIINTTAKANDTTDILQTFR